MQRVVVDDVIRKYTLNSLELVFVLPDTTDGNTQPIVERAVCDFDVGAVCFHRDAIIAVNDCPPAECDV